LAGTWFLLRALREHRESEDRYRQMANNIQEIFWMIDAESKKVRARAALRLTGRIC
jgi:PAS domain-containing protein